MTELLKEHPMIHALNVCIADDEPFMLLYLDGILTEMGHRVVSAVSNGVELVEQCQLHRPDLIVTDIRMPRLDGTQAVEAICREMVIPAIFVTGYARYKDLAATECLCVSAILIKPFSAPDLKAIIRTAMTRHQEFQALVNEEEDPEKALHVRPVVERAKAQLASRRSMSETQAFTELRQLACTQGIRTGEAARRLLEEVKLQ